MVSARPTGADGYATKHFGRLSIFKVASTFAFRGRAQYIAAITSYADSILRTRSRFIIP
jgi:hypothetical protein